MTMGAKYTRDGAQVITTVSVSRHPSATRTRSA
jgi:hypothetical protein